MTRRIENEFDRRTAILTRPEPVPVPDRLRVGDIYSGVGGVAVAARCLGLDVVYAVERDADARRAYLRNTGIRPRSAIPKMFDGVPALEILVVNLPDEATDPDDLERRRSPFQEAARLVRVRSPLGVVVRGPSGRGAAVAAEEIRRFRYSTTEGSCGQHSFVVGTLRPVRFPWPAVDEDGRRKGFPDGWVMPDDAATSPSVPIWRAVIGSVLEVVKGGD